MRWHGDIMRCHAVLPPPSPLKQQSTTNNWWGWGYWAEAVHLYRIIQSSQELSHGYYVRTSLSYELVWHIERGRFSRTEYYWKKDFFLPLDLEVLKPVEMPCSIGVGIVPLEVSLSFPPIGIFVPETVRVCFQINLKCVEQHSANFQSGFNCRPKFSAIHNTPALFSISDRKSRHSEKPWWQKIIETDIHLISLDGEFWFLCQRIIEENLLLALHCILRARVQHAALQCTIEINADHNIMLSRGHL